jgi:propanol-preferring alcohol dehydrogenase
VKVPARNVFKIPDRISYEEAAVIPDAVSSPFHALKEKAKVRMGDDIAIMGIGGLGIHAVQIAKLAGAKVIAIDISSQKLGFARRYGADEVIDARKENAVEKIRSITHGKGVDSFVDLVGNSESVHAGLHGLRKGGRLVLIGHDPHHDFRAKTFQEIIMEEIEITGSHASTRRNMEEVLHLLQDGRIKPVVAAQYPLKEANEAHRVLQTEEILGRIVLVI